VSYESFRAVADECKQIGRVDLALAIGFLAEEYQAAMKKAHALDEIVADAAEDERLTYLARQPPQRRWTPTVILGGAA